MVSSGLEKGFSMIWAIVKLNFIFITFTLLGGLFLGIGPAFQTISDLVQINELGYRETTWKLAFERWKVNFIKGNLYFYLFFSIQIVIFYNLYLSSSLQGLIWMIIDFILLFAVLLLTVGYLYVLMNESTYELSFINLFKLSFISIFLNFTVFLKIIVGLTGIILFTLSMKGLILFGSFSLIILWLSFASKKNREWIDGKLTYEN
ncbi:DUF624 domain-containing protein [Enterococcus sp. BWT-B8]|uniref:YesL family protein n=1 Tax=unclassified Enterococcus TaxID=2608891 RepID=UPI001E37E8D2|nr:MULTISPECIES: DUF624 domain-containing protein [unclassified Enterococcus]MCB5951899.1 DUF624 domain-containing protein [Enterococcus sp. BWT-B8]MCB5954095.1 DUF624 domain-containing protein [Enterococcus sp. CWB-B31]